MRITGGIYKNRKIMVKARRGRNVSYRPTAARTRLAIFNILENSKFIPENFLLDAVVADICCGSGSFGLEAISRGAQKIFFIDKFAEQLSVAKENVAHLKEEGKADFIVADALNLPLSKQRCKIVYIDPPYGLGILNNCLENIVKQGWLEAGHIIIVELSSKEKVNLPLGISTLDVRVYGKTKLLFLYAKDFK